MSIDCNKRYLLHTNVGVDGYSYVRNGKRITVKPYIRSIKRKIGKKIIRAVDKGLSYEKHKLEKRISDRLASVGEKSKPSFFEKGKKAVRDKGNGETIRYDPTTFEERKMPVAPKFGSNRNAENSGISSRLHTGPIASNVADLIDLGKYAVEKMKYDISPTATRGEIQKEREQYLDAINWYEERKREEREREGGQENSEPGYKEIIRDIEDTRFVKNYNSSPFAKDRLLERFIYSALKTPIDSITAKAEEDRRHLEELGLGGRGTMLTRTPGGPSAWIKEKK